MQYQLALYCWTQLQQLPGHDQQKRSITSARQCKTPYACARKVHHRAVTSLRCRKESTSVRIHNVRPTIEQGQRCSRSNTPLSLHMYKDITHSVYAHRAIWAHVFHAHGGRRDHGCPQREYLRRRQCELADSTSTRRGHCLLAELIMCSRAAHTHAHKIQRRRYKRKKHKT